MGRIEGKVSVDHESFLACYEPCALEVCQGMCCYDGVFLQTAEVTVIEALIRSEREAFLQLKIDLQASPIVLERHASGSDRAKTRTVPFDYLPSAELPDRFQRTACVFRCGDGRCSLQVLAMNRGLDPWAYKPMGCWMHPLELTVGSNPRVTVSGGGKNPFSGCTQCGRQQRRGKPGYQVFQRELDVLSDFLGQDLSGPPDWA